MPALKEAIRLEDEANANANSANGNGGAGAKRRKSRNKGSGRGDGRGDGKGQGERDGEEGGEGKVLDGRAGPRSENIVLQKSAYLVLTSFLEMVLGSFTHVVRL